MLTIERLLIGYTEWLFKLFEITPEQIERSRPRHENSFSLRPEGARGLNC